MPAPKLVFRNLFPILMGTLIACIYLPHSTQGQTWTGLGADDNWSTGANWNGGQSPSSDTATRLTFDDPAIRNSPFQDIADPFQLIVLTADTSSGSFIFSGSALEFAGVNPQLTTGGSNDLIFNHDWVLTGDLFHGSISGASSGPTVIHNGNISGAGDYFVQQAGGLTINGSATGTGKIAVAGGGTASPVRTLTVNGTVASTVESIELGSGSNAQQFGNLRGTGTIDTSITSAFSAQSNFNTIGSSGTLTINGSLSASTTSSYRYRIVEGTIALNGNTTVNGSLILDSGATLAGSGEISVANPGRLTVNGILAATKSLMMDGSSSTSQQFSVISGAGTIASSSTLSGGILSGSLIVDGDVEVLVANNITKVTRYGTYSDNTFSRSSITTNGTVTFDSENATLNSNAAVVGGDHLGQGVFEIESGVSANFISASIGEQLTINVHGRMATGETLSQPSSIAGTINLFSGQLNSSETIYSGLINVFAGSTINSSAGDQFAGNINVNGGVSTASGTFEGVGTIIIADDAELNSVNANFDQIEIVRGTVTGGNHSKSVTLEGGRLAGQMSLSDNLVVQTQLSSSINSGAAVTVAGLTEIQSGELRVESSASLLGIGLLQVNSTGVLDVQGIVSKGVNVLAGGMLEGTGLVSGNLKIDGLLGPGNSAGTLDIDGDIELTETSTVCVEIGGTRDGEFDVVDGLGNSNMNLIGGVLEISLLNDFTPVNSDSYDVFVNFASLSGAFAGTTNGASFGGNRIYFAEGSFAIEYQASSVNLFDFEAVPEPGSIVLLGGIGVAVLARRRKIVSRG